MVDAAERALEQQGLQHLLPAATGQQVDLVTGFVEGPGNATDDVLAPCKCCVSSGAQPLLDHQETHCTSQDVSAQLLP
jgi:hypothetical protein